jgi:hypothetical protein
MDIIITVNIWFMVSLCLAFLVAGLLLGKAGNSMDGRYR